MKIGIVIFNWEEDGETHKTLYVSEKIGLGDEKEVEELKGCIEEWIGGRCKHKEYCEYGECEGGECEGYMLRR